VAIKIGIITGPPPIPPAYAKPTNEVINITPKISKFSKGNKYTQLLFLQVFFTS